MRSILVYRNEGKLQVVVEDIQLGRRVAYLRRATVAELPPGYSRTARMIADIVSKVHRIRPAWLPKSCEWCRDYGYENDNGQHVCRFGDNFDYHTHAYDSGFAQRCRNYGE